jgi:hypothetical protein
LEQRLIPSAVSFNLARGRDEIVLRLRDILKSGIAVSSEPTATDPHAGWVNYGRPFVDERPFELVLEIGDESTRLRIAPGQGAGEGGGVEARAEFFGEMRARVTKLLEVVATKLGLPPTAQLGGLLMGKGGGASAPPSPGNTPLSEDLVKVVIDSESSVLLDGKPWTPVPEDDQLAWATGSIDAALMPRKRKRVDEQGGAEEWIVKTGQWRLKLQGARNGKAVVECCLVAVKLDAYSSERARNGQRSFLGG